MKIQGQGQMQQLQQAETLNQNQAETLTTNQAETLNKNQAETLNKNEAQTLTKNQAETLPSPAGKVREMNLQGQLVRSELDKKNVAKGVSPEDSPRGIVQPQDLASRANLTKIVEPSD